MIKLRIRGKRWFLQDKSERHSKIFPSREDASQKVSLNSGLPAQARVVGHLLGDELSLALGNPQRQLPVPPLLFQNSLPSGLLLTLRLQLQLHLHLHTHRTHTHTLSFSRSTPGASPPQLTYVHEWKCCCSQLPVHFLNAPTLSTICWYKHVCQLRCGTAGVWCCISAGRFSCSRTQTLSAVKHQKNCSSRRND